MTPAGFSPGPWRPSDLQGPQRSSSSVSLVLVQVLTLASGPLSSGDTDVDISPSAALLSSAPQVDGAHPTSATGAEKTTDRWTRPRSSAAGLAWPGPADQVTPSRPGRRPAGLEHANV